MSFDLQQFVPSKVCLDCDGCCRFKEKDSLWRPRLTEEEITQTIKRGLAEEIFLKQALGKDGRIETISGQGHYFCRFFDSAANRCRIHGFHPFECQLYPFVLMNKEGKTAIAAHHHCPFIQEKRNSEEFARYVSYLKDFFQQKETRDFIQRNSLLVNDYADYQDELEYLFTLD